MVIQKKTRNIELKPEKQSHLSEIAKYVKAWLDKTLFSRSNNAKSLSLYEEYPVEIDEDLENYLAERDSSQPVENTEDTNNTNNTNQAA